MKNNFLRFALPAVLLMTGAVAQEQHGPDHSQMPMNGMGGMCGMMMSHMTDMTAGHQEAARIVEQLQKNLTAIQAEKKPAAQKEKLAAQAALLKDLAAKLEAQNQMMTMMQGHMQGMGAMQCCGGAGGGNAGGCCGGNMSTGCCGNMSTNPPK
ncbi:MAG TPA: hypothetical protein VEF06_01560 [Bryobacteraceae bacterium]|nr:hypothetical protein [Bryobacteraceae bacterium]